MANPNIVTNALRRDAAEVKRYHIWQKIIPILIGVLVLVLILGYIVALLYTRYGAFTVKVNRLDEMEYLLTLSDTEDFESKTSRLNAQISDTITNIDGATLPKGLANVDGVHSGDNYLAYTFYCKNEGTSTVTYQYELYIANMTLDAEKAIRIRLYVYDCETGEYIQAENEGTDYTDFAYPRTDGEEGPEPGTTEFRSATTVCKRDISGFKPGDATRFTVVMWFEGNDPECIDDILGGELKFDMSMNVMKNESDDENKTEQTSETTAEKAKDTAEKAENND